MEKTASGKAGGSTGPVKQTSRISEIGEGAFIRWSAEIRAYLPAGAAHNDLQLIGSGKKNGRNNILLIIDANENLRSAIRNQAIPQIPME